MMVILKPTVISGQVDVCNAEASAVSVYVLSPCTITVFAEQFLSCGDGDATDHVVDMVDKRSLVVRDGFGINLTAGFQDDRETFIEPIHWVRFGREAVVI